MPLEQPLADLRNVRLCRLMLKPKIKLKLILFKPDLNLNVVDVCKCKLCVCCKSIIYSASVCGLELFWFVWFGPAVSCLYNIRYVIHRNRRHLISVHETTKVQLYPRISYDEIHQKLFIIVVQFGYTYCVSL